MPQGHSQSPYTRRLSRANLSPSLSNSTMFHVLQSIPCPLLASLSMASNTQCQLKPTFSRSLSGGSQIGICRNPWAAAGRRVPSEGHLALLQMLLSPGAGQSLLQDEPLKSKGPEYYSAIKKNTFESVLMKWMKLEPIIQSEVSQKEKHQYSILTHIYGI